ncbi:MAG TPA: thiol protease/hemagglutinin PrtT [Paludibacter sp.]|nr:thiol protease/hemagglutinin PrtT [Paludibacter sp.]
MRKITLLTLAVFFFVFNVLAKQRNQNEAIKLAGSFLQNRQNQGLKIPIALSSLNLIYTSKPENKSLQDASNYYVYNIGENKGFVIISGDDRAKTVLGYSDSGYFDYNSAPENLKSWLNFYNQELEVLSATPEKTSAQNSVSDVVQKSKSKTNGVAPILGGIKWNQNSPYNDLCPLIPPANTQRAATGCVATAMAQVMNFYEWPVTGTGSNTYTSTTHSFLLSADFSATTYDWANMTDTYGTSSTPTQKTAVATLMYHCGISTNMNYDFESSTSINSMAKAMKTNFGYDTNIQQNMRDFYTRTEWVNILKSEIDASRPLFYSGNSSSGGHMFICDGYDANDLFHFNWGWGGLSNGYFEITALNPGDIGIGGGNGSGYNSNQAILKGIQKPNPSSVPSYILYTEKPLTSSVPSTTRTGNFDIDVFNFFNYGVNNFSGKIGLALYNGSTLIQLIDEGSVTINSYMGWGNLTFSTVNIPTEVTNGIYKMYIVYKATAETDWQIVRGRVGTPNYLTVSVSTSLVQFSNPTSEYPQLTLNSLSTTGNLYQNKTGRFNVNISNTGGEYNSNLIVNLTSTTPSPTPSYKFAAKTNTASTQDVATNPANITTNETVDLDYSGIITVAPGAYNLSILYDPDNNPSTSNNVVLGAPIVVNVLAEPTGTPVLSLTQIISFPDNNNVPKNNAVLTAHITNTGAYFENQMIAFIFPSGGGASLGYIGLQNAIIDAGESTTVIFNNDIDLPVGNYKINAYYKNGTSWTNLTPSGFNYISFTLTNPVYTLLENTTFEDLLTFPNPATDNVSFNSVHIIQSVKILDLSGRQVLMLNPNKKGEISIPIYDLEKGVYILQSFSNEKGKQSVKFIKK